MGVLDGKNGAGRARGGGGGLGGGEGRGFPVLIVK